MISPEVVYDTHFNANEWFVIVGLCLGLCIVFLLPRRFHKKVSAIYFLIGITIGAISDHNIGTIPISVYDTSDTSAFDIADIPAILMYGPYSYLFCYIYDLLHMQRKFVPVYVLIWAFISVGMEWAAERLGVFHYNYGYWLGISFVIYLVVHSLMVALFHLVQRIAVKDSHSF